MEKLDEILKHWDIDCIMDETKISTELVNIPKLHAKYIRFLNGHKLSALRKKFEYDKMKEIRSAYYLGHLDQETLDAHDWNQFDIHVSKAGLDRYINSDDILINLLRGKVYHEQAVYVCESILTELKNRSWQLKTLVDYEKLQSGS